MATKKRSCWLWLEDRLYSFCAECAIILLTLISVLAIATELLIGLRIITAPYSSANIWHDGETDTASPVNVTTGSESQDRSTRTVDPGGYPVDPSVRTAEIVCHYISFVIAALFMAEICVKLLVKNKDFFKDRWQMFDAVVVMVTLALEILLSVIKTTSEYPEAATFVVILRLWRLHKVCNMKTNEWSRESEPIEIYQYEETKKKEDDDSRYLQLKVDKQEKEIKRLESMLRRYQQDNNIDSNRNNTETLLEISESKEPYDRYAEVKSNSIIESATQEAAHLRSSFQSKMTNGHVPNERSRQDLQEVRTNSESETDQIALAYGNGNHRLFRADSESSMSQDGGLTHDVMVDVEGGPELQDTEIVDVERGTVLHGTEKVDMGGGTVLQDTELYVEENNGTVSNKDDPVVDGDTEEGQFVYTNQSFETDVSLDDRNWPVLSEIDGTKTYRSAEGIPMTSL